MLMLSCPVVPRMVQGSQLELGQMVSISRIEVPHSIGIKHSKYQTFKVSTDDWMVDF